MNIIVRKEATHSMFKPHFNSSMNKWYQTKDDYLGDLKRHKLEPFHEIPERKPTPYKLSSDSIAMCKQARAYEKRKEKPGTRFISALNELGIAKKPKWLSDAECLTGGFKNND